MDDGLGRIDERVKNLEAWRAERDREREVFRGSWSTSDVDKLRAMLNGYIAAAAVKAFWSTWTGRAVIIGAAFMQVTAFALAITDFLTSHHHP